MAIYADLAKLGRVQLPSGNTYALIDVDGRAMIAPNFSSEASYNVGDHVIYGDNLYRFKANHTGEWNSNHADVVSIDSEIKRIENAIQGGISFIGKTTTALYEGATTNPISIGGSSVTVTAGNLVILDLSAVATAYAVGSAYSAHSYIVNGGIYYYVPAAITAGENTSFNDIADKINVVQSDPEFLFDGTAWNAMGSIADGLGDLAFKDSASGSYVKPTGQGSVTVPTVSVSETKKLSTTTITGTNGTVNATYVTGGSEKDIAKAGAAVRYGTADVGSGTSVAAVGAQVVYGTADVDTAVAVGTSLTGTKTFNTDAIKSATLTGTKTFNTDAIKSASLTGTTTFTTSGIVTAVDGDCLTFSNAGTGTVGISTTAASTGTVGIETTAASTGTVGLGTTDITPAKAADTTRKINTVSSITIHEAVAAPNDQTIVPAVANGTLVGSYTLSQQTPAKVASSATTVATGSLETGSDIVTGVSIGSTSATVTVGTTNDTVVVK